MKRGVGSLRRLRALLTALSALLALGLLLSARPARPDSVQLPLTASGLERLTGDLTWLALLFLSLVVLRRSLALMRTRATRSGAPAAVPSSRRAARARRSSLASRLPAPAEPSLVLALAAPTPGLGVAGASQRVDAEATGLAIPPPAAREAEPDDARPLIRLLGPIEIVGGKQSRRGLRSAALELVAYLALHVQGARRDELMEALWPGAEPLRARQRLYQAVRDARRLLGEALRSERDRYWLDRARVRVDLDELQRALEELEREPNERARRDRIEQALALLKGEPLAGVDYLWAEGAQRRLTATLAELVQQLGRLRLEAGDARAALEAAERALELDLLDEGSWRLALEAESALGLREAVELRYEQLRLLLDERLGLQPAQETRLLYRRVLSQR